ncbi:MAG: histidine phosphatase family protein [Betaproteobacteria bacterium]|nr:histidine phosphatase family protein [Betaproteobacteria bacterium]
MPGRREPPATVCVVRHGETDWNTAGILQGWIDVPLNDLGRRQAHALGDTLAGAGIVAVHTSPLLRCRATAEIVAARLGLPSPAVHDGLKERHFGIFQGIPKAELAEANPQLYQQILQRNPAGRFEEGEAMDEFATRVQEAILDLAAGHGGECLLVVTHGWAMDVVAREADGLPRHAILHVKPKNGECLWLEVAGRSMRRRAVPPRQCG